MQSICAIFFRAAFNAELGQGSTVTTKGRTILWITWLLQESVDIDVLRGKVAGNGRHDAGPVIDHEPYVVRHQKIAVDSGPGAGDGYGAAAVGDGQHIRDYSDGGGLASGPVAGEDSLASVLAARDNHIFCASRPRQRGATRDKHRPNRGQQFLIPDLCP